MDFNENKWEDNVKLKYLRFLVDMIKTGIKIQKPKKNCKCFGRGWRGYNTETGTVNICPCILQNKADIEQVIVIFLTRSMKRNRRKFLPHRQKINKQMFRWDAKHKRWLADFKFINRE